MKEKTRVVFTQGGKGGVGKTEILNSLIKWYHEKGIAPVLLDFDIENANKSGLKNFFPEALKLDVHREGALDEFFDICGEDSTNLVVADLGAGAGEVTYQWFDEAFEEAEEEGIAFTSIGVTTEDAGAVQSILTWGAQLQDRVDYLIVLNEQLNPRSDFKYWHAEPKVAEFKEIFSPHIMTMQTRIQEFQAELRNQAATLEKVIQGEVKTDFLRLTKNRVRARRYQRELYEGFEQASSILLPPQD